MVCERTTIILIFVKTRKAALTRDPSLPAIPILWSEMQRYFKAENGEFYLFY
jgi:hypothetical protein